MKSPVVLLSCLLNDIKRHDPSVEGLDRDLQTIERRFEHEGYGFFTHVLPTLGSAIDIALSIGRFSCPTSFKRRQSLPVFLQGLTRKVFDSQGFVLEHPDTHAIKCLRELCYMFKKLTPDDSYDDFLHKKTVRTFLDTEDFLKGFKFPSLDPTTRFLSRVVLKNHYDSRDLVFRHGPGSVAERLKPNAKWQFVFDSIFANDYLTTKYDFCNAMYSAAIDDYSVKSKSPTSMAWSKAFPIGISRLITVPKTAKSKRTITIEPCLHQYVQQGLNKCIRDSILKCPILSNSLDLNDQSKNQKLALEGSRTGAYCTIDLSSASDLVSTEMVKAFFSGRDILIDMLDSRSKVMIVENTMIEPLKYSGMGNATMFPVQSIIFATICIAAVIDSLGIKPSYRNFVRASRMVRVYGDDIIVPTDHYTSVSKRLSHYGLQINHNKTFSQGFIRESCGTDAYRGSVITPIYVKHMTYRKNQKSQVIQHWISLSNSFFERGLYQCSIFFKSIVEQEIGPLPLVRKDSASLGWHTRVDANTATKWCGKTQRLVFRGLVSQSLEELDSIDGHARLLKRLSSARDRQSQPLDYLFPIRDSSSDRSDRRFSQKLRRRWLPV